MPGKWGTVCEECGQKFKSNRALKGHQLHCPTILKGQNKRKREALTKETSRRPPSSNEDDSTSSTRKRRKPIAVPSVLDEHKYPQIHTLHPYYPLSYVILHGMEHRNDPLLEEARKLFALVYPTIPKDFQLAAVRAHCNSKQDFRSFRTVILSIKNEDGAQQVVSCATVKVHAAQGLLEVLFIATNPTLQRRGYGRLLLHLMQDLVRKNGVTLSIACASSDAVPFWRKMGFAANASSRVHGWRLVQLGGINSI
eukprot:jgi/Bigna1/82460/fgenesh1_pg.92_\